VAGVSLAEEARHGAHAPDAAPPRMRGREARTDDRSAKEGYEALGPCEMEDLLDGRVHGVELFEPERSG